MTLKVILVGIMTLVPDPNWENPRSVTVLLNKGGGEHAKHSALLFYDPEEVDQGRRPVAWARIAERACSGDEIFRPTREMWVFNGHQLGLMAEGTSPLSQRPELQVVRCENFRDRFSSLGELKEPCQIAGETVASHKIFNDIRWLLDLGELMGQPAAIEPSCFLPQVLDNQCNGALAARLEIKSGLLYTAALSGGSLSRPHEGSFRWLLPHGDGKSEKTTFAGVLIWEINFTDATVVELGSRSLLLDGALQSRLRLKPRSTPNEVIVTIENSSLRDFFSYEKPCEGAKQDEVLGHAPLIYGFQEQSSEVRLQHRPLPEKPASEASEQGSEPRPKCEPPNGGAKGTSTPSR